jgi:hypothetical protein
MIVDRKAREQHYRGDLTSSSGAPQDIGDFDRHQMGRREIITRQKALRPRPDSTVNERRDRHRGIYDQCHRRSASR